MDHWNDCHSKSSQHPSNTHINTCKTVFLVSDFKIWSLSNFQIHNIVLLTIITILSVYTSKDCLIQKGVISWRRPLQEKVTHQVLVYNYIHHSHRRHEMLGCWGWGRGGGYLRGSKGGGRARSGTTIICFNISDVTKSTWVLNLVMPSGPYLLASQVKDKKRDFSYSFFFFNTEHRLVQLASRLIAFKKKLFLNWFLATLGLHCYAWAFSSYAGWGPL